MHCVVMPMLWGLGAGVKFECIPTLFVLYRVALNVDVNVNTSQA